MNKIKKAFWTMYSLLFCKPYSLHQFKIFCTKIDGMTESEFEEFHESIKNDETLSNFFKL